jgi:pimeloyl-ACP methyl ester carboxylesterase
VFSEERWRAFLQRVQSVRPGEEDVADTLPADMVSGLRYYRANAGRMRTPRERRTAVPVLLLVPTRDVAIMGFVHDEVGRWVERLERHDVPHGHWLPLEAPDVVAEETAAFIRSVAPGSAS